MIKTGLYNWHKINSANIVSYAGYLLPVYYSSIVNEHNSVRKNAGLFDVSHMGEFFITGENAERFVQLVTINDVSKLSTGKAQYTAMCDHNGGIIDDVIVYKLNKGFMMVVNSANIKKDFEWLNSNAIGGVKLDNKSDEIGLISIQGPKSRLILQKLINTDISNLLFYHFIENIEIGGHSAMLSRTGYTGELGFEIYVSLESIELLWEKLISVGKLDGLIPAGLGCRDTLRLEMNYLLYGNDIDQKINPIEAGLEKFLRLNKSDFIGKDSIINAKKNYNNVLSAFLMIEKGIPRNGFQLLCKDQSIGHVTSGTMSPVLGKGIGLCFINKDYANIGNKIEIDIRGKLKSAMIVKPPFYKTGSLLL